MGDTKLSRRQFLGGAAAVVAGAALPALTTAAPAAATPDGTFPGPSGAWVPLDPKAAARRGFEIYKGKWAAQAG
ncbi:MAG: twin-arginine translocation signal domain-containing protein [Coriobacteriales bacterium]|nr:twin-arginine translocation signal domain-containing protein [Actinomycetes bacterium]